MNGLAFFWQHLLAQHGGVGCIVLAHEKPPEIAIPFFCVATRRHGMPDSPTELKDEARRD